MLSALLVVGIATTAGAESTVNAGKKVGNAVSVDTTSAYEGSTQVSSDATAQVKASEVLGSLKNSATAISSRITAVLSSKATPYQKGDLAASSAGTTAAPGTVSADVTSTGKGVSASVSNTGKAISGSASVALSTAAAKKTYATAKSSVKAVANYLATVLSATGQGTSAVASASWNKGPKSAVQASEASSTNVSNALSSVELKTAFMQMKEMNEGQWNNGRDFELAVAYFTDAVAYATGDASFSAADTALALEMAASVL